MMESKDEGQMTEDYRMEEGTVKYLVGIGASAGGVEALQTFFENMPPDTGAAFIVVQHLSPDAVSLMDKILQKVSKMPVLPAQEGLLPQPNHIYLNIPGKTLTLKENRFHLESVHDRNQLYLPINMLFQSLASAREVHPVAVILSGSGSDGAIGIGSIKESGGLVIVQKPEQAQYASMPQSAIVTGMVDLSLNVSEMGSVLRDYLRNPHIQSLHKERAGQTEMAEDYAGIINAVSLYSGIDFTIYKTNTIYRRIERRIALNKFRDMSEYLDYLLSNEEERENLFRDLLIGVTSFFRDEEAYYQLGKNAVIPLLKRKKSIRLWSVACSTGEEAYSLAILVCECMEYLQVNTEVKIFATDVDRDAVMAAQKGIYSESLLENLSQDILDKYFERVSGGYLVSEKIRKMIVFARHNIFKDAPFSKIDLISCRNMFIYVKPEMQQKALAAFYRLLEQGGYLFLGSSETIGDMEEAFNLLDKKWKIYSKNLNYNSGPPAWYPTLNMDFMMAARAGERENQQGSIQKKFHSASISEKIMFAMAGPSVLIDENRKVIRIIQGGGQYMRMQDGQFDGSLNSIFSPSLAIFINHLLAEAKSSDSVIEKQATGLTDYPTEILYVKVSCFNLSEGSFFLLQISSKERPTEMAVADPLDLSQLKDGRIRELEKELNESNWNLKLAVEESESRNEELQATNEELLASNEELQSTNEEMQSVNEELYTINAEYQNKIVELTTANADFDNLLLNADVGALYVDEKMCIRKITPLILQHTNLKDFDMGRPITQINFLDSYPDFIQDVSDVSRHGKIIEKEITDINNSIWLVRIRPYFDHTHSPKGVLVSMFDITKRLETAKYDLKRLTDSVPGGVLKLWFDNNLYIEYANDSFFDMTGYTADEVKLDLRNRFDRLLNMSDWSKIQREINETVMHENILKTEFQMNCKNGTKRWCSLQAVVYQQGRRTELQCIVTDISLIKKYEEKLRKERDYYNALYQNVVCGIVQYEFTDEDLRCYNANVEAVKMLGYDNMEEFRSQMNQTLGAVTVPADVDNVRKRLLSLKKEGECVGFEHRVLNKNDGVHWVSGVAKIVCNPDGKKLIQSTFMDITEEKRALEQVVSERDRYDHLYNMLYNIAVCGIVQVDTQNKRILNINHTAFDILDETQIKETERALFGRERVTEHEKSLGKVGAFLCSLKKNGEERRIRFTIIRQNGDICVIEGSANRISQKNEPDVVQFTFLDVTEHERLKEAQLELAVATQSSAAKTNFLSKMSHEIRTPMNGIVGMLEIASMNLHNEQKLKDCMEKMRLSMQHLQRLVNDVLDMSKIESGKMECKKASFDLQTFIGDIISEFTFFADQTGVRLAQEVNIRHPYVVSDSLLLREVLGNLISNAIKFTESDGIVMLTVEENDVDEGRANFTFRVRDTGCGISPEAQKCIFNAFEQGDGNQAYGVPGTGLGLAICKNLVELLGGELQLESQVAAGSEFYFTILMKTVDCLMVGPEETVVVIENSFAGNRVLLAEDNELNAEIAQTLLSSYGFEVECVGNGEEALNAFVEHEAHYYDLILMDIQMPVMNGLTAAGRIRAAGKADAASVPIIAMSANAFDEDIERSLNAGMNAHMSKPIEMKKLMEILGNYLIGAKEEK